MSNVELYEALKGAVGEKAAGLIAEVVPPARDLATKSHVDMRFAEFDQKVSDLDARMREGFATLRAEIQSESKHTMRWMLGLFIPVWAATWGTLLVALLKL